MNEERRSGFSRKALGWMIGASVGSFLVAFVMAAFGDNLSEPRTAGNNTFSYSALGHRAAVELLRRSGLEVRSRRSARPVELVRDIAIVLAEPREPRTVDEQPFLTRYEHLTDVGGSLVVILPKWEGVPDAARRAVSRVRLLSRDAVQSRVEALLEDREAAVELVRGGPDLDQTCDSPWGATYRIDLPAPQGLRASEDLLPLLSCSGRVLAAQVSDPAAPPAVYVVADPDLMNNHGLIRGEHAGWFHDLFLTRLQVRKLVFDETAHGFARDESLIAELLRFPLLLAVLHGLLVLGLVVWAGVGRFGKPREAGAAITEGRQLLIDNAAQLLSLGGHTTLTSERYYAQTLRAVGAHYFFPSDMPLDLLENRLQQISLSRGLRAELRDLRHRMRGGKQGAGGSAERTVKWAGRLHRWRREMTHGAGRDS